MSTFRGNTLDRRHYAWISIALCARIIREPTRNYVSKCPGTVIMHNVTYNALRRTRGAKKASFASVKPAIRYISFASRKNQERIFRYFSMKSNFFFFKSIRFVPVSEAVSRNFKID